MSKIITCTPPLFITFSFNHFWVCHYTDVKQYLCFSWNFRFRTFRTNRKKSVESLTALVNWNITRKNSSRMPTTHLETICAPVKVATTKYHSQGRESPNEQVWTGLQWSLPDVTSRGSPGMMSRGRWVLHLTFPGGAYRTIQPIPWCIWCYLSPHMDRQTPVKTLPSRNFVCRR